MESTVNTSYKTHSDQGQGSSDDSEILRRQGERQIREYAPGPAERNPEKFAIRRRRLERVLAWAVPIVLIGMWQMAAERGWIDVRFFPAPTSIVESGRDLIESGLLLESISISARRILIGYAVGVGAGIVLGLLLGVFGLLRAALEPMLMALYVVPKLAILPLLLLIFGLGETPKVIAVGITVFFFMWVQTMEAVVATPKGYREALESFDASRWQMFRYVYFPSALPQIFVSARLCAGISVLVIVGIEFVQGNEGIGYLIWNSWSLFLAGRMYVGIVAVSVMGLLFATIVKIIGKRLLPWAPSDNTHGF